MSEHITKSEIGRYFAIMKSGTQGNSDNIDFVNDIDAHVAECRDCFERMQATRLMMKGLLSNRQYSAEFIAGWLDKGPTSNKHPVFHGLLMELTVVKEEAAGKIRVLADLLGNKINAAFVPNQVMAAGTRGVNMSSDEAEENDLLNSNMEIEIDNHEKISVRCRKIKNSEDVLLYICSKVEIGLKLTSGEKEIPIYKKEYDDLLGEYVVSYKLDDKKFALNIC